LRGIIDLVIGIVFIVILLIFYILFPSVIAYFFLTNRWISPRERRIYAYIIILDVAGIILLVAAKFLFG
jgi:hypothetical protein